ncbi:MAG: glycosyltransferase family 39 protein, partial [Croceivirga sp.]
GRGERSGIFFIFWEQSFERMSGQGVGKNSSDYFFFFHTFLWVFLPWTVLALTGYVKKLKEFVRIRFVYSKAMEFLTLGGITLIFFIISFAQFKLPHYMNIMMPLYALMTAWFINELQKKESNTVVKPFLGVQYFILGAVFIFSLLLSFYVFKFESVLGYIVLIPFYGVVAYFCLKREAYSKRLVTVSVLASVLLNGLMNLHFYPNLLQYQGGSNMAKEVAKLGIPTENIYKFTARHTWALDFYNRTPVKITSLKKLKTQKDIWVYVNDKELAQLKASGFRWNDKLTVDQFRITRLQLKFLNPITRDEKLNTMHLVRLD